MVDLAIFFPTMILEVENMPRNPTTTPDHEAGFLSL
jgi:hypothetical protein